MKNWTVSRFKRQGDSNHRKRDLNRLLIILKCLGFCKGIRIFEKEIRIAWRRLSYWKLDSNPWKRDSNCLKIFWLLENRFESFKEKFESLENILATGKWIRIAQRGIRIAKVFFHYWKLFWKQGFESLNRGFKSLNPKMHECSRKCQKVFNKHTNSLIIRTYHTEKFNKHECLNIIHINHAK